jgi:hypothetical protein
VLPARVLASREPELGEEEGRWPASRRKGDGPPVDIIMYCVIYDLEGAAMTHTLRMRI